MTSVMSEMPQEKESSHREKQRRDNERWIFNPGISDASPVSNIIKTVISWYLLFERICVRRRRDEMISKELAPASLSVTAQKLW